jgi:SAM-dependent methyltransferase
VLDPDAERRLAQLYDPLDPDRSDLDAYAAMAAEFGARSVLDIGCGTGTFACLLAAGGLTVTGVDPNEWSLEVARTKPGAEKVRWVHGSAADVLPLTVDLATMTANVAQEIVTDDDWAGTLRAAFAALRPGGRLVFETRDPARRAWLNWDRAHTYQQAVVPGIGGIECWLEVVDVSDGLVTFGGSYVFEDGLRLEPVSTLRFRAKDEVNTALAAAGFELAEVRDAPDRPGREFVFIASRPGS